MPKYKSHFKEEWKETYPWITNFKEDTTRALCRLCNSDFSVATTGEIQVKDHAGRDKLIKKQKQYSKQTTLFGREYFKEVSIDTETIVATKENAQGL